MAAVLKPSQDQGAEDRTDGNETTTKQEHTISSKDNREHVCLTHDPLDVSATVARVKDPGAGAIVLFAGQSSPFDTLLASPSKPKSRTSPS